MTEEHAALEKRVVALEAKVKALTGTKASKAVLEALEALDKRVTKLGV